MPQTIYDGFHEVEVPRYDLDITAKICARIRLRSGYAVIMPVKHQGGLSKEAIEAGLVTSRQDGIPSAFAIIVAVSPFELVETPVKMGDVILKNKYAGQPIDSPSLVGSAVDLDTLAPMERSVRGLQFLNLRDIIAVFDGEQFESLV